MLEWFNRDPRKFFYPLFDYSISDYFLKKKALLVDLGYNTYFTHPLKTERFNLSGDRAIVGKDKVPKGIIDRMGLDPDLDEFPIDAYKILTRPGKKVIIDYGNTVGKLAEAMDLKFESEYFSKLVKRTEAGLVPVIHSHLLFKGCPHPLIESAAYSRISSLGGFKPLPDEKSLAGFELRFQDVFSSWSDLVLDARRMAGVLEAKLENESGAREMYSLSLVLGADLDLEDALNRIGGILEIPHKPNLMVYLFS